MSTMARETDLNFDKATKTIRFTDDERDRLREVMRRVRGRTRSAAQMADPSKLIKELMGLADFGLLIEDDRRYIAGLAPVTLSGTKPTRDSIPVAGTIGNTGKKRKTQSNGE